MELIIKPTELCNFKCTFCSSTKLVEDKASTLDIQRVFDFLERFPNTNTIIVNGGDPLMVKPEYYFQILDYIEEHKLPTTLGLTTNLWAFYKKPEMWTPLFKHPRVGVTTSFQYGMGRIISGQRVYMEKDFWKVSDLFLEKVGYRPGFIAVISEENEKHAIRHVELAKKMDVQCKLNYAMASGEQSKPYRLSKIYETYIEIYERGLHHWEFNTKQMMTRLNNIANICPQARDCDDHIRALNPEGDYYSCGAMGDDKEYPINFVKEVKEGGFFTPLQEASELFSMKDDCMACPLFNICNGCKKTIKDLKSHDMVEEHCAHMKTLAARIIKINSEVDYIEAIHANKSKNILS
jgi:radical SAM protein with 4Fe4S-binding SPASM domain